MFTNLVKFEPVILDLSYDLYTFARIKRFNIGLQQRIYFKKGKKKEEKIDIKAKTYVKHNRIIS